MPVNDTLTPMEASYIATNAYFTLKDWINNKPVAGKESRANVHNRVLGAGTAGVVDPGKTNPTLRGTPLASAGLGPLFTGNTGFGTTSGFGYLLDYRQGARRHVVIAARGTRPELGAPDLLTDLRGAMTGFGDWGAVHKGFRVTYDSVVRSLLPHDRHVMQADVVHCVGHSLGGAVATLIAAHFSARGKAVKLYTFGSPRVGAGGTHSMMEKRIGKANIYRVAHDLDPISMIGPFPYIHLNPSPRGENFMTIPSPTGKLFSTANHDMNEYISSVGREGLDWAYANKLSAQVEHDNAVLSRWLLHEGNSPGWVQVASAQTLSLLFKLFAHVLRTTSTSVILGLTAVDLLAELLVSGMARAAALSQQVFQLLRYAASWAGITVNAGADFTVAIIQRILQAMLARLKQLAVLSLDAVMRGLVPLPLVIAGSWVLANAVPL